MMKSLRLPPHFHWEWDSYERFLWVRDTGSGKTALFTEEKLMASAMPIEYTIMEAFIFTPPEPVNIMAQELDPWDEEEGLE